jgi:hypothetical protein
MTLERAVKLQFGCATLGTGLATIGAGGAFDRWITPNRRPTP